MRYVIDTIELEGEQVVRLTPISPDWPEDEEPVPPTILTNRGGFPATPFEDPLP